MTFVMDMIRKEDEGQVATGIKVFHH